MIQSEAVTDRSTRSTLTFHSYFNLAGEDSGSIADHELQIRCDKFVLVDEHMTLLGTLGAVADNNDFRDPQRLGDAIPHLFFKTMATFIASAERGGDAAGHVTCASSPPGASRKRARDGGADNGKLSQLYTGALPGGSVIGKSGVPYVRHTWVATSRVRGCPDGANVHYPMGNDHFAPGGEVQA